MIVRYPVSGCLTVAEFWPCPTEGGPFSSVSVATLPSSEVDSDVRQMKITVRCILPCPADGRLLTIVRGHSSVLSSVDEGVH